MSKLLITRNPEGEPVFFLNRERVDLSSAAEAVATLSAALLSFVEDRRDQEAALIILQAYNEALFALIQEEGGEEGVFRADLLNSGSHHEAVGMDVEIADKDLRIAV